MRLPPALLPSLKFVCNGWVGSRRSLADAQTIIYELGWMSTAGKTHFRMLLVSSLSVQFSMFCSRGPGLYSSIQSWREESSSLIPELLLAMNSERITLETCTILLLKL